MQIDTELMSMRMTAPATILIRRSPDEPPQLSSGYLQSAYDASFAKKKFRSPSMDMQRQSSGRLIGVFLKNPRLPLDTKSLR